MHSQRTSIVVLVLTLAMITTAADFSFINAGITFIGWKYFLGVDNANAAYRTCTQVGSNGQKINDGAECVFSIMKYFCGVIFSITAGGTIGGVAKVVDGLTGAQQTEAKGKPPKVRVRDVTIYDQVLLDNVNQHIATTQPESFIRADAIVPSDVHPHDGLAFRMNIHSDNSTLHIHTNGSSYMTLFHEDDTASLVPRAEPLPTDGHHFHFTGMGGMKVEWHNINHAPGGADAFPKIMNAFVLSDLQPHHIMEGANAWDFEACNNKKTATFAWGRFWFKESTAKLKYEAASPRGCNS